MSEDHTGSRTAELVDHLFRRQAGRMVAALVRILGPAKLDLAEEVVQEALVRALQRWPFHGIPDDPQAWLLQVARNRALDRLRREARFRDRAGEVARELRDGLERRGRQTTRFAEELDDDQLRLVFMCCHPELPLDARVALTLKSVCSFSVGEIARAFLAAEATVAQRLVRAKRRIRDRGLAFELPDPRKLPERLAAVLEVVYLTFNEGYGAHGDALLRRDLCEEAVRMAEGLARSPAAAGPAVEALLALMLFQLARFDARLDAQGNLVPLAEQDRALWDRAAIGSAFEHLRRSAAGPEETAYHLQAAIAACHATAPDDAGTDWAEILALYDRLQALQPSPVVELNRAVAVGRVDGTGAALEALAPLAAEPSLAGYYLLPATRAHFLAEAGRSAEAAEDYRQALALAPSAPERRFLMKKLAAC